MLKFNSRLCCITQNIFTSYFPIVKEKCCMSHLVEIGQFEAPKTDCYQSGQLFIHKLFGYRGLIVFPWTGQIYDRDENVDSNNSSYEMVFVGGREVKFFTQKYYQVFVDSRDRPYVRTLNEVSTAESGNSNSLGRLLHYAPGLDYVSHEDILPYKPTEKTPIKHEMVGKFFVYQPDKDRCFEPRDILKTWQEKNSTQMKIDVHKETTEKVSVTAIPFYLGCQKMESNTMYSWRYSIRFENFTGSAIRIKSQNWRIFSLSGLMETVFGLGVKGKEVVLDNTLPAFQYSSHADLLTPYGHMIGNFKMEKKDGSKFYCRVPLVLLESKGVPEEMMF